MSPAQPFADVRAAIERVVKRTFPKAKAGEFAGEDGWIVMRPASAARPYEGVGTMPSDRVFIALADRKAGPTLYVWYPNEGGIGAKRAMLEKAGFKVMVGCLVYTKKQPYPIDAVETLLLDIKARDGAKA